MARAERSPSVWRVLIVILVIVDVVLVVTVLRLNQGSSTAAPTTVTQVTGSSPSAGASSSPEPSPSAMGSPSPSPSPSASKSTTSPEPDPADTEPAAAVPVERLLVAVDGSRAWRASKGSCEGGGGVSITGDGGRNWDARRARLASISRLVVRPGTSAVFAVGTSTGCDAKLRRTDDRGSTWADVAGLDGFFHVDPRDPGSVAIPGRGTVSACSSRPVIDMAVDGGKLRVLCPGGRVRSIGDGDSTWADGPTLAGAIALATNRTGADRTYAARVGRGDCDGVQIVDIDKLDAPVSCIRRTDPVRPGSVSLSTTGSAGWLLVGADVYTADATLDHWVER